LALEFVGPLLKAHMEGWNPLLNPTHGVAEFKAWRELLQQDTPSDFSDYFSDSHDHKFDATSQGVYLQLTHDVLMPKIRSTISNLWNPRHYDSVIIFVDTWQGVLPEMITENILDQLVLPKLNREVDAWNPRLDTVPIHAWLHPWLPLLGQKMEPLYPLIRHKLQHVLQEWHPSDPSAHAILLPWQKVFDHSSMEALLVRSIIPKLIFILREFVINPVQQYIEPFQWLMLWEDMIPVHHFVALLEVEFFPKWLNVLFSWLSSRPDYNEVSRWYLGWKDMFPPDLLTTDRIRIQFNIALEAMNKAVSGSIPSYYQPPPAVVPPPVQQEQQPQQEIRNDDLTLKQMVETIAAENDVTFLPTRRQHESGKQIYAFGTALIYWDKGKVYLLDGAKWKPISADSLITRAKAGK